MPSERKLAANRRNAQRSTGPKTEAGRRASSLNALKHGLRSPQIVLPGENQAEFDALYSDFAAEAQPRSASDLAAVRKIAACEWRLRRLGKIEAEMFTCLIGKSRATEPGAPASDLALVARCFLEGDLNRFTALARYEASLDRQYRNAWRELDCRPEAAAEFCANEPNSPAASSAAVETARTNPTPESPTLAASHAGWESKPNAPSEALAQAARTNPTPESPTCAASPAGWENKPNVPSEAPAQTARTNPIPESTSGAASPADWKTKPNASGRTAQTQPTPKTDTPRNAPCPCGSKLKYKRCCGINAPAVLHFPNTQVRRQAKAS